MGEREDQLIGPSARDRWQKSRRLKHNSKTHPSSRWSWPWGTRVKCCWIWRTRLPNDGINYIPINCWAKGRREFKL